MTPPTVYHYGPGTYNVGQLQDEITAAGLPVPQGVNGSGYAGPGTAATHVDVACDNALTAAQKMQLDGVVAAHVPRGPRQARPLWSIRGDVQALTPTQWSNTWADLSAAVPGGPARKYLSDYGPNAGTIFCYDHVIYVVGGTTAQVKAGQVSLTACFCQDNWSYLWHPPFDPSIAIDGSEPA